VANLSPNFYTPSQCLRFYGRARTIDGITIHWWGDPAQHPTFDAVVNHLCNPNAKVSAHYVVEAGRRVQLVDEANAAWHAGSAIGNATQVGIECNPRASDEDYVEIAALIADIRARKGDKPLWPHKHWYNTACPGVYDLARLDRMARAAQPASNVTPAPTFPPIAVPTVTVSPIYQEDDVSSFTTEALQAAYRLELGRDASQPELDPRIARIARGQSTLAGEIDGIDKSTESNRWAVHQLYLELLKRDGSVSEWDSWINLTGNDLVKIRAGIVNSDEYKKR